MGGKQGRQIIPNTMLDACSRLGLHKKYAHGLYGRLLEEYLSRKDAKAQSIAVFLSFSLRLCDFASLREKYSPAKALFVQRIRDPAFHQLPFK